MADDKKFNSEAIFIIGSQESSGNVRSYRKYAMIAGVFVLTIAIILTAALVGMFFVGETQKRLGLHLLTFSYGRGDNQKEDVISDPVANIVQYHITSDTYEAWVFNDFNRDIQVMKIQSSTETNCFVTSLNRTIAMDPSRIATMGGGNFMEKNESYYLTSRSGRNPRVDSSFLCKPAKDGCQGISTYWLFPDGQESREVGKRQKRRSFKIKLSKIKPRFPCCWPIIRKGCRICA